MEDDKSEFKVPKYIQCIVRVPGSLIGGAYWLFLYMVPRTSYLAGNLLCMGRAFAT